MQRVANPREVTPAVVEVVGRFRDQGHASVLFEVLLGPERWLMKVPRRGTGGVESASAREFVYSRFAERLGLPVVPVVPVAASAGTKHHLAGTDLYVERGVFTATPLLRLGPKVASWSEVTEADRAALAFWENATAIGTGDKIRLLRPRDFFHWSASPRSACPVVMLDYESLEAVWSIAVAGGLVADGLGVVEDTLAAVAGLSRSTLHRASDEALASLDDPQWNHVVAGADLFWPGELPDLRRVMRKRIEQTNLGLGV